MRKVQNQMVHGRSTVPEHGFVHNRSAVSSRNLFEQRSDYVIKNFYIFFFFNLNITRFARLLLRN